MIISYNDIYIQYLIKFKDIINQHRINYDLGIATHRVRFYENATFPFFQVTRTGILFQQSDNNIQIIRWEDYDKLNE